MACSNAIEVLRCSPDKLITLNWFQNSALWEELCNRIQLYSTSWRHNYCSRVKTSSTWSNSQWQMRKNAKSTKIRNHSEGFAFLSASFYAPNRIPHVSKVTDDQLVNSKMLFFATTDWNSRYQVFKPTNSEDGIKTCVIVPLGRYFADSPLLPRVTHSQPWVFTGIPGMLSVGGGFWWLRLKHGTQPM